MREKNRPVIILLADDDADDRILIRDAIHECYAQCDMRYVENGEELMDYLQHRGKYEDPDSSPRPSLIFLDLNMPRKDGRESLKEIKEDTELKRIPVVILTTSKAEEDIKDIYDLGGNSFISKPVTFDGLVSVMRTMKKYWFETVELPHQEVSP